MDKQSNLSVKMKEIMFDEELFESIVEKFTFIFFILLIGVGIPFMFHLILQLL